MSKKIAKKVSPKKKESGPIKKKAVQKAEKVVSKPSSVALISFSVSAVIPTQQYGNIQPEIVVTAETIKEARDTVMPIIEELYRTYAELPLNGKEPRFYSNIVEKVVIVGKAMDPVAPAQVTPSAPQAQDAPAPVTTASAAPVEKPKAEAVLKAEKAISLAMTYEAAEAIQEQIQKSVKIDPADKGMLFELCLKKKKELQK